MSFHEIESLREDEQFLIGLEEGDNQFMDVVYRIKRYVIQKFNSVNGTFDEKEFEVLESVTRDEISELCQTMNISGETMLRLCHLYSILNPDVIISYEKNKFMYNFIKDLMYLMTEEKLMEYGNTIMIQ